MHGLERGWRAIWLGLEHFLASIHIFNPAASCDSLHDPRFAPDYAVCERRASLRFAAFALAPGMETMECSSMLIKPTDTLPEWVEPPSLVHSMIYEIQYNKRKTTGLFINTSTRTSAILTSASGLCVSKSDTSCGGASLVPSGGTSPRFKESIVVRMGDAARYYIARGSIMPQALGRPAKPSARRH